MPKPHVPDLNLLEAMEDHEVRFYAIQGVLMSLMGGLERSQFQVFEKGCRLDHNLAAKLYHAVRSDDAREILADEAMSYRLAETPELATWKGLKKRMKAGTIKAHRNLVGHNPTVRHFTLAMAIVGGAEAAEVQATVRPVVKQDPVQVKVGNRPEQEADFAALKATCLILGQLHRDLDQFLASLT